MFLCPRCGSTTFRSTKLPNGSVERECTGQVVDERRVPLVKEVVGQTVTRDGFRLVTQSAPGAPVVVQQAARACTFFDVVDDSASQLVGDGVPETR